MKKTNHNKKIKILVDIAMTAALPVLMAYSLIGEAIHEWLGLIMFALFALHHLLNWHWHKNIIKGRYSSLRILGTTINVLMCVVMVVLPVSGMWMAKYTFTFLNLTSGMSTARIAHLLASYWGFALMSLHMGIHGSMILGGMRKMSKQLGQSSMIKMTFYIAASLLCVYGITAFFKRQFHEYMFLNSQFVFFDLSEPLVIVLIDYIAVMWMFAYLGYHLSIFLKSKK